MVDSPTRMGRALAMGGATLMLLGMVAAANAQESGNFVENVYFTRGQWGDRLDYLDGDDTEPLWLVTVVEGAPRRNFLCVDWLDDDDRVLSRECQSLPEGSASLAFESPRGGHSESGRVLARLEVGQAGAGTRQLGEYILDWPRVMSPAPAPPPPEPAPRVEAPSPYIGPPEFPWYPPKPTSSVRLDRGLLTRGTATLRDVADHLVAALDRVGYSEKSFYVVPGGFALVTRLEQIKADGTPMPGPDRWSEALPSRDIFSLGDFISRLFNAPEGNYRVIAFIVTDQPFGSDGEFSATQMGDLLAGGLGWLPQAFETRQFTAGHVGTALVYQFRKVGHHGDPVLNPDGAPNALDQLDRTGIFASLRR